MDKLTMSEAKEVLAWASEIVKGHASHRLGQAIWWCAIPDVDGGLTLELSHKLDKLLEQDRGTVFDFYGSTDAKSVMVRFYERYVESV